MQEDEVAQDEATAPASKDAVPEEKTADEILPASVKRSPIYNPKYGGYTRSELQKLANAGNQIAEKMKKLVD
ncbi:MAG: hypothetical protein GXC78_15505 [Chitinophagaceae bacterium]|nr:hypothetical protein [Chitinophagaceae bacterium]